jgi:hypothetical protein
VVGGETERLWRQRGQLVCACLLMSQRLVSVRGGRVAKNNGCARSPYNKQKSSVKQNTDQGW